MKFIAGAPKGETVSVIKATKSLNKPMMSAASA